ncbi:hypothetical protein M569_10497 [Genlisea aurea]|uniref:Uncharacterized protein n=1 Tax=Genlisea aurea TaxID=192259 RepID=S8CBP1_9LAMI|nr:hypothetical protein M569_10497 [Genlisea aurea]
MVAIPFRVSRKDLRRKLDFSSSASVFVVDSHRPIHLPTKTPRHLPNASDLNSDDEIDADSDSDDDDDKGRRKRRRIPDEDENNPMKLYKRLRKEYHHHMGTFHGKPSGCLMYGSFSFSPEKNNNELLWLACVALTDQFVHQRLTDERYRAAAMELEHPHQQFRKFGGCHFCQAERLHQSPRFRKLLESSARGRTQADPAAGMESIRLDDGSLPTSRRNSRRGAGTG